MASLFIYMNGREVGEYIRHRGGVHELVYSDSWLGLRGAMPLSLSLPLTDKRHRGDAVYNYFDNLLPDSIDIRNRIQARFGVRTNQAFDLLSSIGRDCVGAIQLTSGPIQADVKKIEGIPLTENDIAEDLRNYKTLPLGMSKDRDFRISIAGAQEKTALLKRHGQWHRPVGVTPTTHIVKLPIGQIEHTGMDLSDSVENEWLCLEILKGFGLPVAAADIVQFEDVKTLVVERFDRKTADDDSWIIRLPTEDMCQANGIAPALKYENEGGPGIEKIMGLLRSSVHAVEERYRFMQTVFLFWLLGAIDGHAKNFSIFLRQGGRFELTPVYDVMSAYPLASKRQIEYRDMKMAMALRGQNVHYAWHEIMPRHWFSQSDKVQFPKSQVQQIIEEAADKLDSVIDSVSANLSPDFPEAIADAVFTDMKHCMENFARPVLQRRSRPENKGVEPEPVTPPHPAGGPG